ncbi:GNAT family N-acetyltransferase [Bifidobacterium canis]|uniref:GNAT family acetyltransferase n=1 Tax=Bifidobacterium canis TaxID=2610880 RepID=A0A7K1J2W3_9BIFI|nr:GNAT family N-acetyltransferase [Bifidobacterium canis]MUH58986.1 GNAT family acetyltransferase [Bifidobacterium canis]
MEDLSYRLATAQDVAVITNIYNKAVMRGGSTADTAPVTYESRAQWLAGHTDPYAVFILEHTDDTGAMTPVGFSALSVFYDRPGYDGVCDLAYYLDPDWQGRGIGTFALRTLLEECRARSMRKACAIIFAENTASNALVRKAGFQKFGEMPEAAYDAKGILHDMSYWYIDL